LKRMHDNYTPATNQSRIANETWKTHDPPSCLHYNRKPCMLQLWHYKQHRWCCIDFQVRAQRLWYPSSNSWSTN
jgi:hypothetical protein